MYPACRSFLLTTFSFIICNVASCMHFTMSKTHMGTADRHGQQNAQFMTSMAGGLCQMIQSIMKAIFTDFNGFKVL